MLRVVVDVNVLVSALLGPRGNPARIVREWAEGAFELVVSPQLLRELTRVLAEKRLSSKVEADVASDLEQALRADGVLIDDPPPSRHIAADPDDDYLVTLAIAAAAHVIVSGDRHLLDASLAEGVPRVVAPAAFVALLESLPE